MTKIVIDLAEIDRGKPHWLSWEQRDGGKTLARIRAKNRAKYRGDGFHDKDREKPKPSDLDLLPVSGTSPAMDTSGAGPNSSAPPKQTAPTASNAMTREELMRKLSANPRFKEVKNSGEAYIIVGAKPLALVNTPKSKT